MRLEVLANEGLEGCGFPGMRLSYWTRLLLDTSFCGDGQGTLGLLGRFWMPHDCGLIKV